MDERDTKGPAGGQPRDQDASLYVSLYHLYLETGQEKEILICDLCLYSFAFNVISTVLTLAVAIHTHTHTHTHTR